MPISFDNIVSVLDFETQQIKENGQDKVNISRWVDNRYEVIYLAQKKLLNDGASETQRSSFTATLIINPPNEQLCAIITNYFLSVKIPGLMDAPECLFFDKVTINGKYAIK